VCSNKSIILVLDYTKWVNKHLKCTAAKLNSCFNLISNLLANTVFLVHVPSRHQLWLRHLITESCCSIWSRSYVIDAQIHSSIHLIAAYSGYMVTRSCQCSPSTTQVTSCTILKPMQCKLACVCWHLCSPPPQLVSQCLFGQTWQPLTRLHSGAKSIPLLQPTLLCNSQLSSFNLPTVKYSLC